MFRELIQEIIANYLYFQKQRYWRKVINWIDKSSYSHAVLYPTNHRYRATYDKYSHFKKEWEELSQTQGTLS